MKRQAAFDIKAELEVHRVAVKEMNGHFVKRVAILGADTIERITAAHLL